MHLAALQRSKTRRGIVDDDDLDLVGMAGLVAAPVVGEALAAMFHAGLVDGDLVRAGADAGIRVVLAAIRLDDQMVVGHQIGEVGIGIAEGDHHFLALGLDRLDVLQNAERAGFRLLVRMALERGGDILRAHRLAVVELDAVADLHRPGLGIRRSADLLGYQVLDAALRGKTDEEFAPLLAEVECDLAEIQRWIQAVGRLAALQAGLDDAALYRRRGESLAGQSRRQRRRDAESRRAAKEIAARDPALAGEFGEMIEFRMHVLPPFVRN